MRLYTLLKGRGYVSTGGIIMILFWLLMLVIFIVFLFRNRFRKIAFIIGILGVIMSISGVIEMIYIISH